MSLYTFKVPKLGPVHWESKLQIIEEKENMLTICKVAFEFL